MPDSLDPTELLANAKPQVTYEIEPSRLDEMLARVTSASARVRFPLLRTWQMRAGSALAAALVTVAAVLVSLGGGPGLTVLTLEAGTAVAGPATHASLAPTPIGFSAAQAPVTPGVNAGSTKFVVGSRFLNSASPLAVFRVTSVPDPSASLMKIAAALGVRHARPNAECTYGATGSSVLSANAVGTNAIVTEAPYHAAGCTTSAGATLEPVTWTFNLKGAACELPSSLTGDVAACPLGGVFSQHNASHRQLALWSSRLTTSLLHRRVVPAGMTLGKATFLSDGNVVTYPLVTSSGVASNQYEEFQFSNDGSLVYATGLLASTSLVSTYPAISELKGVELLQAPSSGSGGGVNPGGPKLPASTTTTLNTGGPMIPASTTTTVTPPSDTTLTAVVSLSNVTLSYRLIWLSDGSAILAPQYVYRASDGVSEQVLALDPSFYQVEASK